MGVKIHTVDKQLIDHLKKRRYTKIPGLLLKKVRCESRDTPLLSYQFQSKRKAYVGKTLLDLLSTEYQAIAEKIRHTQKGKGFFWSAKRRNRTIERLFFRAQTLFFATKKMQGKSIYYTAKEQEKKFRASYTLNNTLNQAAVKASVSKLFKDTELAKASPLLKSMEAEYRKASKEKRALESGKGFFWLKSRRERAIRQKEIRCQALAQAMHTMTKLNFTYDTVETATPSTANPSNPPGSGEGTPETKPDPEEISPADETPLTIIADNKALKAKVIDILTTEPVSVRTKSTSPSPDDASNTMMDAPLHTAQKKTDQNSQQANHSNHYIEPDKVGQAFAVEPKFVPFNITLSKKSPARKLLTKTIDTADITTEERTEDKDTTVTMAVTLSQSSRRKKTDEMGYAAYDNSELSPYIYTPGIPMRRELHELRVHSWLRDLLQAEQRFNSQTKITVSENAINILKNIEGNLGTFDYDNLPLGFFTDKNPEDENEISIKFDLNYRLQQLEKMPAFELSARIDFVGIAEHDCRPNTILFKPKSGFARKLSDYTEFWDSITPENRALYDQSSDKTKRTIFIFINDERKYDQDTVFSKSNTHSKYLEAIIPAVVTMERALVEKGVTRLPSAEMFTKEFFTDFFDYKLYIDLVLLAKNPVLQNDYLHESKHLYFLMPCKHALKTGYSVIHPSMGHFDLAQINSSQQPKWMPPFYPDIDALSPKSKGYSAILEDDSRCSKVFARMAGLYLDDFPAALKFMNETLSAQCSAPTKDTQSLASKLQKYININFRGLDIATRNHRDNAKPRANRSESIDPYQYPVTKENFKFLLKNQLKLSDDDQKDIEAKLKIMNTQANKLAKVKPKELIDRLLDPKKDREPGLILSVLRELVSCLSEGKIWLRTEQAIAILLSLKGNHLFQIETGEGKTLILSLISLMNILMGSNKQVLVLTHTDSAADDGLREVRKLASLLNLKVGKLKIGNMDHNTELRIAYSSACNAVLNDISPSSATGGHSAISSNKETLLILDEADNTLVDVAASTKMQVSNDTTKPGPKFYNFGLQEDHKQFVDFLTLLHNNYKIYASPDKLIEIFDENASENNYWIWLKTQENTNDRLKYWHEAAVSAEEQRNGYEYTIQTIKHLNDDGSATSEQFIRIVSNETGRRDDESIWSNGLHQMVAIKERSLNRTQNNIVVPPEHFVTATGDMLSFIAQYPNKIGVTGTLGTAEVRTHLEKYIYSKNPDTSTNEGGGVAAATAPTTTPSAIIFPRAERHTDNHIEKTSTAYIQHGLSDGGFDAHEWPCKPTTVNPAAPLASDDTSEYQHLKTFSIFCKRLDYKPQILQKRDEHDARIVEAIRLTQKRKLSCMVFCKNIADCDRLYEGLKKNIKNLNLHEVQIFDDSGENQDLRPSEQTIKDGATLPGKVTLTTAAGGRAIDIDVNVGIQTHPYLERVMAQERGRIGRKTAGMVYKLYCEEDFVAQDAASDEDRAKFTPAQIEERHYVKQDEKLVEQAISRRDPSP